MMRAAIHAALGLPLAVAIMLAVVPATASATPGGTTGYERCRQMAGGVQPSLKACDSAELAARDALLNRIYRTLMAALPPPRQAGLRNAERAWLGFRDAECDFRMSAEAGGANAALLWSGCRLDLTARRIDDLQRALRIARF